MTGHKKLASILLYVLAVGSWHCSKVHDQSTTENSPVKEIKINVKGEYTPSRIVVKKDQPVKLVFYRDDTSDCTKEVVLEDFKIRRELAANQNTTIELTPEKEGEFTFACGMRMMEGKLVVEK